MRKAVGPAPLIRRRRRRAPFAPPALALNLSFVLSLLHVRNIPSTPLCASGLSAPRQTFKTTTPFPPPPTRTWTATSSPPPPTTPKIDVVLSYESSRASETAPAWTLRSPRDDSDLEPPPPPPPPPSSLSRLSSSPPPAAGAAATTPFDSISTDDDLPSTRSELYDLLLHVPRPEEDCDEEDNAIGSHSRSPRGVRWRESSRKKSRTPAQRYLIRLAALLRYRDLTGSFDVVVPSESESASESESESGLAWDWNGVGDENRERRRLKRLSNWVRTQRYEDRLSEREGGDGGAGKWLSSSLELPESPSAPPPSTKSWMTPRRRTLLDAVGFDWRREERGSRMSSDGGLSRSGLTPAFLRRVEDLRRFRDNAGHCCVPQKYPPDPPLGVWAKNQRVERRRLEREEGKRGNGFSSSSESRPTERSKSSLTPERIAILDNVGFAWDGTAGSDDTGTRYSLLWKSRVSELRSYARRKGHADVPQSYGALGVWVKNVRAARRSRDRYGKSHLTPERVAELDGLGFRWEAGVAGGGAGHDHKRDRAWGARLGELEEFKKEHGHADVPIRSAVNDGGLGTWVANQRAQYRSYKSGERSSSMTPERIEALEGLGFTWDVAERRWWDNHARLVDFRERHGNVAVTGAMDPHLTRWIRLQRRRLLMHPEAEDGAEEEGGRFCLTDEMRAALQRVGLADKSWGDKGDGPNWDQSPSLALGVRDGAWLRRIEQLSRYKDVHGNCLVPRSYPDNPGLGNWVQKQRTERRRRDAGKGEGSNSLTNERIKMLDELEFIWSVRGPKGT